MRCVCGAKIPDDSPQYAITPQYITMIDDKGKRQRTWESFIVMCPDNMMHPPDTSYNYVEQAKLRGD